MKYKNFQKLSKELMRTKNWEKHKLNQKMKMLLLIKSLKSFLEIKLPKFKLQILICKTKLSKMKKFKNQISKLPNQLKREELINLQLNKKFQLMKIKKINLKNNIIQKEKYQTKQKKFYEK